MIVLDASAAVEWLLQTTAGHRIEQRIFSHAVTLHTVHLLDVEFAQVMRRLVREGTVAPGRAQQAIEDLAALRISRYAPVLLLPRIWRLRQNLSAYDAAYIALAEELQAPLITRDRRIAGAPGHTAAVEVF
jgi:predicted nucleic acid-binding protein